MNTGLTPKRIGTEIRSVVSPDREVYAAYGFGSFFRGGVFSDIDLLVVTDADEKALLPLYYRTRGCLSVLGGALQVRFDLLVFTLGEFTSRALRDMDSLVRLYTREGVV